MSESIHAGYLPLWNPYINFGFPQYGDMSGGFWSPITWLIASTVGYNAYTFTIELLCYILLGGLGMYRLTGAWQLDKKVRIIAGIAYMCCGYNVGHLQHFNWISGAAFLPWCLWSYLLLLNQFSIKSLLRSVLLFYLLASSAHPGIIIGALYFFAGILIFHLFKMHHKFPFRKVIKQVLFSHTLLVVLLALLSAGMIAGYLDIIPHFVRGEKVSLSNSLLHPANIQTWISALLPFSTVKNDAFFNTDPSMRNSYFGLVLLLFFLLACFNKKNNWQMFLLITGLFFALLSAGGIFKTFAYKFIPFTGYVRLNGEFRIFTLLCFIAVAAIELDKFTRQKNYFTGSIKRLYYLIGVVLITCIIVGFYQSINTRISGLFGTENIFQQDTIALTLKTLIDTVSFYDTLWIQGILQLILWWGIKRCLISGNIQLLKKIVVADLVLASLLNIPFTGVGKISVATVQSVINESPGGIPIPVLQPINNIDTFSMEKKSMIGDRSIYNKQIGVKSEVAYPIMLKNMKAYFDNDEKHPGSNFLHYPFVFFKEPTVNSHITIEEFSPNKIKLLVDADSSAQIILQQNYYPHWSYQIDGNKQKVEHAGINFMGAPVIKGRHHIEFIFDPWVVKWGMLLSTFLLVIYCILLILTYSKQSFLSQAKKGVK